MAEKWIEKSKWIWILNYNDNIDDRPGKLVLFRKSFTLRMNINSCVIYVSADTRSELFINGISVIFVPAKSYSSKWYYDIIDIAENLSIGENVIAVKVLLLSYNDINNDSFMTSSKPGLIFGSEDLDLYSDEFWKEILDENFKLVPVSKWNYILGPLFINMNEIINGKKLDKNWKYSGYDGQ